MASMAPPLSAGSIGDYSLDSTPRSEEASGGCSRVGELACSRGGRGKYVHEGEYGDELSR